jgi:hypothetical protein
MNSPIRNGFRWVLFPAIQIRGYLWLLAALFILFIIAPWLSTFTVLTLRLSDLLSLLVLFAGILAVSRSRIAVVILTLLALGTVFFELLHHFGFGDHWAITANILAMLFLFGLFMIIEFDVFSDDQVTAETLAGACCGYVLIAAIFASIYSVLLQFDPNGLKLWPGAEIIPQQLTFQSEEYGVLGYYSIATLTTLGYGDIVPNSTATRNTAAVEALIGQLYLAVIVARLVGMYITTRTTAAMKAQAQA